MAILVTGAGGLIGRAAVAALLRQEVEHVRAVVRDPGQSTPVAWVEHSLARSCPLAYTGPKRTLSLVGVGLSSFTLGVLVLIAFAYRGRHASAGGRHLAAPYRPGQTSLR